MHDAADVLRELADLFTKKNQGYGPTYHSQGKFMQALFPNGIELKTDDEFKRFAVLDLIAIKLQRYCNQFSDGGHEDSALDLTVYASMLVEIDRMIKNRDKRNNLHA